MFDGQVQSLYWHFPYCRHLCNYCDFFKLKVDGRPELVDFHQWAIGAWDKHEHLLKAHGLTWAKLTSIYFGGGTPSLWGLEGVVFFKQFLQERKIALARDCEWTMEVNPNSCAEQEIEAWMDIGVNRFSMGVQSLNGRFLKILDRLHRVDDALSALAFFKRKRANFSVDLMIGLPFSKDYKRNVIEELEQILDYGPSHISLYILTVAKQYIHFKDLPSEEWIVDEYLKVSEFLAQRGMIHYEVSNYALKGKESRHNLKYWNMQSVAAIGPSGTGLLVKGPKQGLRYQWRPQSLEFNVEHLGEREMKLERLYMLMRTNQAIEPQKFFAGKDLDSFMELAKKWRQNRYLTPGKEEGPITLGPRGFVMLDSLMDDVFSKISDI